MNDLGFSENELESLKISEVGGSTKDTKGFCADYEVGPMEGLKIHPHHASASTARALTARSSTVRETLPNALGGKKAVALPRSEKAVVSGSRDTLKGKKERARVTKKQVAGEAVHDERVSMLNQKME